MTRRLAGLSCLACVLALAACGDGRVSLSVRLLDPGGRLYDHGVQPAVHYVDPDGDATQLFSSGDCGPVYVLSWRPLAGGHLEVVAPGCRVERVPAPHGGEFTVRLRRGVPVRLRVRWDGTLPEGVARLGVSLELQNPPGRKILPGLSRWVSIDARWVDEDQPTMPHWTPVEGRDPVVSLYVPEPGRYRLEWHFDAPSAGFHAWDDAAVEIREGDEPQTFEREFPAAEAARGVAASAARGRPR